MLQRAESTASIDSSKYPDVEVKKLPKEYWDKTDELAGLLKGQDALVSVIPSHQVREHLALATSCCMAKVQRMIPADYGSVDSDDAVCIDLVPLYGQKQHVRRALQGMTFLSSGFYWTSIISGHFLDSGLEEPLLGFDVSKSPPTAIIFDGGDIKWSATTRARIGEAVVKILSPEHEEQTRNKLVYIQGVDTTQNEVLSLFEKISGKKFDVTRVDSKEYIADRKKEIETGMGHDSVEKIISALGVTRANWEDRPDFVNQAFGFGPENLEEVVREAWAKKGAK